MKDIIKLGHLLLEAKMLMVMNIRNADNIDLDEMSQTLDDMIDELNKIKDFEKYEDE